MAGRDELADRAWEHIQPLLPENSRRGKQWRGIATRYDKRAAKYRAAVVIAGLTIWLTT
jgi:hypothetical protein